MNQTITPNNSERTPTGTILTRTICVNITGSLSNFALAGAQAAVWKPMESKQAQIFGCLGKDADAHLATNQLRTALIHEVNLLEHKSDFPVTLGVKINCLPSHEVTDLGNEYAYTVLPNSNISTPHNIYRCDVSAENSQNWRNEYPKWNSQNLEHEGVLDVANNPYVFVHQDHPIIALLRSNSALIGCNIDEQPMIDEQWYKVTRQVLMACCQTLRNKVLSKIASNDLNTLQVQLERVNSDAWDEISDEHTPMRGFVASPTWTKEELENAKRNHVESFLATPYSYMARIQLKYEVQSPS